MGADNTFGETNFNPEKNKPKAMTDRELLKEARHLLAMCTLIDESGHCQQMVDKIDDHFKQ